LKQKLQVVLPIGTSDPWGNGMKWSTLGVRRSKVKGTWI